MHRIFSSKFSGRQPVEPNGQLIFQFSARHASAIKDLNAEIDFNRIPGFCGV
jgi:hypothetical protein